MPKTIVNLNLFLHKALSFPLHERLIAMKPSEAINLPRGCKPQIEILTRDEQIQLVRGTHQHRYGVFALLPPLPVSAWGTTRFRLRWIHIRMCSTIIRLRAWRKWRNYTIWRRHRQPIRIRLSSPHYWKANTGSKRPTSLLWALKSMIYAPKQRKSQPKT